MKTSPVSRRILAYLIDRLLNVLRAHAGENAPEIQAAILESIRAFVGDAPQFDDITLMTLKRE